MTLEPDKFCAFPAFWQERRAALTVAITWTRPVQFGPR